MDPTELEHLLEKFNAEIAGTQLRLTALMRAADGIRTLLGATPATMEQTPLVFGSDAGHVTEAASVAEAHRVTPAPRRRGEAPPRGKKAAQLILQSDTSRFWSVREVDEEEVRHGMAEPRLHGAKGNPPARIALDRLRRDYPQNVEVITSPVLAYRWNPDPLPRLNGSGTPHADRETAPDVVEGPHEHFAPATDAAGASNAGENGTSFQALTFSPERA